MLRIAPPLYIYVRDVFRCVGEQSEIDLIGIACSRTNNARGLPVSSSSSRSCIFPGRVLTSSPPSAVTLRRKITSTCNSAVTCNASLARYRKRHSRPLVTTALKRRSIFRRCVSSMLYAPQRLNPRGGPCSPLPPARLLLFRALSRTGLRGGGLKLRFAVLLSFFISFRLAPRRFSPPVRSSSVCRPRLSRATSKTRRSPSQ